MNKKVTIRDVAETAGVSISTVHQALNGKAGVSGATRTRIREIAERMGYQPNPMASSLKRKTRHIVVFLPGEDGGNRFYYPAVWHGVRDYLASAADMNLICTEIPLAETDSLDPTELDAMRMLLREQKVDGLLTVGYMSGLSQRDWQQLQAEGVAVSLIGSDNQYSNRLCCVLPDYDIIGRTMAELILDRIPHFGSILLCAGNAEWGPHQLVVRGFENYLSEKGADNLVYYNRTWDISEESYAQILQQISRPDVAACCSVLSQSSVLLGRALEESGKAGKVFAVGSDMSKENCDQLRRGVFQNLIQKNPYAQGYLGIKILAEYLTQGKRPERPLSYVGSEVVFQSNLAMYQHGEYRFLLL